MGKMVLGLCLSGALVFGLNEALAYTDQQSEQQQEMYQNLIEPSQNQP